MIKSRNDRTHIIAQKGYWVCMKMASSDGIKSKNLAESIVGRDKHKMGVAAIDFGTTYSGYAFALRSDFAKEPPKIDGHQWATGGNTGFSLKTSTCVLFQPNGIFHSFGFEAEDTYATLASDDSHYGWYYFRRFKMSLYNREEVSSQITIEDDKGKHMKAMDVFSAVIKYLKDHMIEKFKKREITTDDIISEDEIYWVLTVPAIWSEPAKQFMRKAAQLAGLPSKRLDISLEPEAASIYCKYIPVSKRENGEEHGKESRIEKISIGTKYLVLDAGGGTVDITVQEVQEDGSLKQVYMANGGDWGGTKVDDAFQEFLVSIVTRRIFERFMAEHRDDYLQLFREFEIKKRTFTPEMDNKVTFRLPTSLNEIYQTYEGQSLKDSFSHVTQKGKSMAWIGDKLRLDASYVKNFFKPTCDAIVEHVETIFEQEDTFGTSVILMVGGFSESPMLRHAVKSRFSERMAVIIPQDSGLSVLKGAVLYGFDTNVISTRVCKRTYGIQVNNKFREGKDPEENKEIVEGQVYCEDRFSRHVHIGQRIVLGESTEEQSYVPLYKDQQQISLKLFSSDKFDTEYCERDKCSFIGSHVVDLPTHVPMEDKGITVKMKFGGTVITVEAKVKKTGEETIADFNLPS